MAFENDSYLHDDEPLMNLVENVGSEGNDASSNRSKSSPIPVNNDSNLKCRKLVIKINSGIESNPVGFGLDGDDSPGVVRDDRKRKRDEGEKGRSMGEKRNGEKGVNMRSLGKKRNAEKGEKKSRVKKSGGRGMRDHDADSEVKEMWDTILDGDFEAEEGEAEREIEELFKFGKKKKEKNPSEISLLAETVVAELNAAAEEDAELNRQEKPATTKLKNLSLLTDIIPRKHLQQDLIRHGVLRALRLWLEPLPDKSIPCIDVRFAVFKCLNDLTIDLDQFQQRKMLKDSDIGKAVMFFYKYDEETTANRKLAKELVEKWSRAIFSISTRFEDMHNYRDKRTRQAPPVITAKSYAAVRASLDADLPELSQGGKSGLSTLTQHASRPEAMPMDFVVHPQSKVDPEAVRAKQMAQNQPRAKLNKKLKRLSAPKRKQLQAVKPSVGRVAW